MAGTVVAVFESNKQAERAAQALLDAGVLLNDITLVNKNAGGETGAPKKDAANQANTNEEALTHEIREVPTHDVEQPLSTLDEMLPRAITGMVIGISAGALLVATSVFFPPIYKWVAESVMRAEVVGGIFGGVIGAAFGAFTLGDKIPQDAARAYHEHIQRGDTLVTALVSKQDATELQNILTEYGGRELGFFTRFIDSVQSLES